MPRGVCWRAGLTGRGSSVRFLGEHEPRGGAHAPSASGGGRRGEAGMAGDTVRPGRSSAGAQRGGFAADDAGGGLGLIEEMVSGIDEMCDVQHVIKTTFTALHDVIKAQGVAIKALEKEVKSKVSAAEVDDALQHKANIVDVNSSLQDVCSALDKKANAWDLDSKPERSEMHDMLQAKAAAESVAAELSGSYGKQDTEVLRLQLERAVSRWLSLVCSNIPPPRPCCTSPTELFDLGARGALLGTLQLLRGT